MNETKLLAQDLFDLDKTLAQELFEGRQAVWEVLPLIHDFLLELGKRLHSDYQQISENVWVGKGTTIAPTASINGPAIIGCNCEIRQCAYIRGNVLVGNGAVIGNSTEIKNAILFDGVQVPHFNYVGDSILGYKAHLGAGCIISNVKSSKGNVAVMLPDGEVIGSGLRKFGAMVGDHVEAGCNSVINPGTIIGRGTIIYPLTMARGYLPANHILKNNGTLVEKV